MPVDFHYIPLPPEPISGPEFISQTEQAINELGGQIDEAAHKAQQAVLSAEAASVTANEALREAQDASSAAAAAGGTANTALETARTALAGAGSAAAAADQAMDKAAEAHTLALDDVNDISFAVDGASNAVAANVTRGNGNISTRSIPLASAPSFLPDPNYLGAFADEEALNALPAITVPNPHYLGLYANEDAINAIAAPMAGNFADNAYTGTEWEYTDSWADSGAPAGTTPHGQDLPGNDGMMPRNSLTQIAQNTSDIATLRGAARRYAVHLGSAAVTDPNMLQAAYDEAAGMPAGSAAPDGTTLVNLDEGEGSGVAYTYFAAQGLWRSRGSDAVNPAQNGVLGIVQGTPSLIVDGQESNAGKIYVESDGSMSLLGYDSIVASEQTVNGIAPDETRDVKLTYFVTSAQWTAILADNAQIPGATYVIA